MKIAGLDIGSTGCKFVVFDGAGNYLGKAYRDYPVRRKVGGHEVDAAALIEGIFEALTELAAQHPDIAGIGITSFGESFVLTDERGEPLHDAMLYTDPRGAEECRELTEKLGADRIISITGLKPHEMYSIGKLMWLKRRRPEVYARAKHVCLMADLAAMRLCGSSLIDYSLATRTMAFDINTLGWSREILTAAGIDEALFDRPVPAGTVAGKVLPEVARRTGIDPECRIVLAPHDQVAAAVGAGAFDGSVAVDGAGTVQCLTPIYDSLPDARIMSRGNFCIVPHAVPGKYATYAFSYSGGGLMQWYVDNYAKKEAELAAAEGLTVHKYLERQFRSEDPTGILVLPHISGAATPYMDIGSRGAIVGITADTGVTELYRACMEGVVYEMRLNYDALKPTGVRFTKLNATGGGAKSRIWMQMKADVLGLPITALETADAGTVGAAMLTGVATGQFADLSAAAASMVRERETYFPRPEMHAKYMEVYERYKKLYEAVRPLV